MKTWQICTPFIQAGYANLAILLLEGNWKAMKMFSLLQKKKKKKKQVQSQLKTLPNYVKFVHKLTSTITKQ